MRITSRVRRLERKLIGGRERWAVFTIGFYEDSGVRALAEQRLLDDYYAKGNQPLTHCVFTNEVPGPRAEPQEEKFLYAFSR